MSNLLPYRVDVPVCAFRPYASREYQDTFPVPTPATVYGMLLSLVGVPREEKERHRGAEMALAVQTVPDRSKVFRELRRGKDLDDTRPDYQDLLMELMMWVWLRPGDDRADPSLSGRVASALAKPASVDRSGGLSLGESSYLVDAITVDPKPPSALIFITPDPRGFYSLPVWVDHVDRQHTVLERFQISEPMAPSSVLPNAWIRIGGRK